ncbi:MAG TPA: peptide chain release factor N(5)-glutamine methyltransferase [Dehalococcoidia bacterium]|nr:peptide chain release factor N(5)-glutamine methyltransferase [Dehalococcoidia bacterium]
MPTVGDVLHRAAAELEAAGIDGARLDAEVLLAEALRVGRAHLLALLNERIDGGAAAAFEALLARRLAHEPTAYIVGRREFYGIEFACTPAALIPRPETEMLVGIALDATRRRRSPLTVADVGSGSGAVAIAIAANAPGARLIGTDTSPDALRLARANARRAGARVEFVRTTLLRGLRRADVIVANLPYIPEDDWRALPPEIRDHEPREALVGGAHGTEAIDALLAEAPAVLAPGGVLAAEVGDGQAGHVAQVARAAFPEAAVSVHDDLAGLPRVVLVMPA